MLTATTDGIKVSADRRVVDARAYVFGNRRDRSGSRHYSRSSLHPTKPPQSESPVPRKVLAIHGDLPLKLGRDFQPLDVIFQAPIACLSVNCQVRQRANDDVACSIVFRDRSLGSRGRSVWRFGLNVTDLRHRQRCGALPDVPAAESDDQERHQSHSSDHGSPDDFRSPAVAHFDGLQEVVVLLSECGHVPTYARTVSSQRMPVRRIAPDCLC